MDVGVGMNNIRAFLHGCLGKGQHDQVNELFRALTMMVVAVFMLGKRFR
jgi:hypothetical protein